jgi:excisionase family DNA binding protein
VNGLLFLDDASRLHLVAAIRRWRDYRRHSGEDVPNGLLDLLDALESAHGRQEPSGTDNAGAVPTVDAVTYSTAQAAHVAGVSERTIERLIQSNDLPSRKVRGRRVVLADDLRAYLSHDNGGTTNGTAAE